MVASRFGAALDHRIPASAADQARKRPLVTQLPAGVPPGERAQAGNALSDASVSAFRAGITVSALLVAAGGVISAAGVQNPRRASEAASRDPEATRTAPTA